MKKVLGLLIGIFFLTSLCLAMGGGPPPKDTCVILITSDPVGARIEIDQDVVGITPLTVVVNREYDPRWESNKYGISRYEHAVIIEAFPTPEQVSKYGTLYAQKKTLVQKHTTPKHLHFDLKLKEAPTEMKLDIDKNININK